MTELRHDESKYQPELPARGIASKVAADAVRIRLPLTHELLAMLVGARRPPVTLALQPSHAPVY
jgi:hypothetical protein